ncbi:MAG: Type IV fimbrial assembly, ATPase PilB [Firmicutes bacterium]|nr:Type IV fimbrial assembly, ATPase PilB [Bacillota bacterium]MDI6705423.1 ATPase, T2SS/T4P/T4SS family [Bacillota bacterium]
MFGKNRKKLGDILVDAGKISKEQLEYSLDLQKKRGDKLGKILVDEGMLSEDEIIEVLEYQLGIPHAMLEKYYIDPEIARLIPESLARRYNAIPIKKYNGILTVAMSDPMNIFAIDELKLATGMNIQPAIASEDDIRSAIEFYYGKQTAEKAVEDFKKEFKIDSSIELDKELLDQVNNAPVVRLVNSIIEQAVVSRASDVHIEPGENSLRIRFRIDGELHEMMTTPMNTHGAVVARIKIMSNLNIAERRLPQDGRVEMDVAGKNLDLRISILPTVFGEKVVIRLLDRGSFLMTKKQLGFTEGNISLYDKLIKVPYGIILVTGPTGSGKTTTLYTALRELNDTTVNIITLEDPVEYRLEGINQVQVNPKAGLTFAGGLRSILRQDPNIIMVGEIRDEETANLAVRAAITGHLVLSTMHTNDASSSVVRLIDMGVEPYLVASSVMGVISQRLVRKICPECRKGYKPGADELKLVGLEEEDGLVLYKGQGCSGCNGTGYRGRTAVHEIMTITGKHRDLINRRVSSDKLARLSEDLGMKTLRDNCIELVKMGITTVEEMMKVVYLQE